MKISENITKSHDEILADPDKTGLDTANKLGAMAVEAIADGIKSRKWAAYMNNFASDKNQLARLCGEDEAFNKNPDGKRILAYVVGNSVCTIETHKSDEKTGTLGYLKPEMIAALDEGLNAEADTTSTGSGANEAVTTYNSSADTSAEN